MVESLASLALPVALVAFLLRRSLKKRSGSGGAKAAKPAAGTPSTTAKAKPRRDFKVKRDRQELAEEIAAARQAQLMQQAAGLGAAADSRGEDHEEEAGAIGEVDAGEQKNFFNMLQS